MKKVCILISTYNGEKYLEEQLISLFNQTYKNILIYVRDDGSKDNTISILNKYQKLNMLKYYCGNNLKPAKSFMDLVYNAPDSDYYAFCDQDDVWLDDKIKIAVKQLDTVDSNSPALYYGTPRLVDENLNSINKSIGHGDKMLTFNEMLIDSNATGCTMVFNKKLLNILKNANPTSFIMHDNWVHKVCIAVNGILIYDDDIHILYRQHSNNVIGTSSSNLKKIKKRISDMKFKKNKRLETIKSLNCCYRKYFNQNDKNICDLLLNYNQSYRSKLKILFSSKIKTKYIYRNLYFKLIILLNLY